MQLGPTVRSSAGESPELPAGPPRLAEPGREWRTDSRARSARRRPGRGLDARSAREILRVTGSRRDGRARVDGNDSPKPGEEVLDGRCSPGCATRPAQPREGEERRRSTVTRHRRGRQEPARRVSSESSISSTRPAIQAARSPPPSRGSVRSGTHAELPPERSGRPIGDLPPSWRPSRAARGPARLVELGLGKETPRPRARPRSRTASAVMLCVAERARGAMVMLNFPRAVSAR
jgi:hypothetical protein